MKTENVLVIIPAFNESPRLGKVITELSKYFNQILVVDDCSTDTTIEVAKSSKSVILISHPINLGQGAALQTGFEYAKNNNFKYAVTFDADGQHDAGEAFEMLKVLEEKNLDILCGSRFLGESSPGIPNTRRLLLWLATYFTKITSGVKVTDAHNGLRVLSEKAINEIDLTQNRMAHASELVSQIKIKKLQFAEYPVTIHYSVETLAKGQKTSGAVAIIMDLFSGWLGKF